MDRNYVCPICGYEKLKENPYYNENLASCEICPCCGFEFGVTYFNDLDKENGIYSEEEAINYYRKMWILTGAMWFYEQIYARETLPKSNCSKEELNEIREKIKKDKDDTWNLEKQLKNINIDLKILLKNNHSIKRGYYKVRNLDDEVRIYKYSGGIYAKDIENNRYSKILYFYNIAEYIGNKISQK